jgi:hypothetical protein
VITEKGGGRGGWMLQHILRVLVRWNMGDYVFTVQKHEEYNIPHFQEFFETVNKGLGLLYLRPALMRLKCWIFKVNF